MTIHKSTRLTPIQRKELVARYFQNGVRIATLARDYRVSRNTIYNIINRSRLNDFSVHKSVNKRYRCLEYGLRRLAKVQAELEKKLKSQALRYNKSYPGEMIHSDNTSCPCWKERSSPLSQKPCMWRLTIFQGNCTRLSYPTEASILLPYSSSKFSRNALTLWKPDILTMVQSTRAIPKNTN